MAVTIFYLFERGILRVYDKRYLWFLLIAIFIMQFMKKSLEYPDIKKNYIPISFSVKKNSKYLFMEKNQV